jgi:hypothetical protein
MQDRDSLLVPTRETLLDIVQDTLQKAGKVRE